MHVNTQEIPLLPPFTNYQALALDEIKDILLYGTPHSWQQEMDHQGFDPMAHVIGSLINFMENIKTSEDFDKTSTKVKSKSSKKKDFKKSSDKGKGKKSCLVHGHNPSCSSNECVTLQAEAKHQKSLKQFQF